MEHLLSRRDKIFDFNITILLPSHSVFALSPSVNVKELLFVNMATVATIAFISPSFPLNSILKAA